MSARNAGDLGLIPGSGRSPEPTPIFLPGESHGWRSLVYIYPLIPLYLESLIPYFSSNNTSTIGYKEGCCHREIYQLPLS